MPRAISPQTVFVDASGQIVSEGKGVPAALIRHNFLFCLEPSCGVAYAKTQKSERAKLATLGVDNRSTATTVLAVRALIELQSDSSLSTDARKLLSFTDNRQDASLQAGHFNDFTQVALLRSALHKAAQTKGAAGLSHAELSRGVFDALSLKFDEYAADPEIRGPARTATDDALRRVIQYHVYRDLERGWRVTAPNLEDCGLLRFEYEGLAGPDGLFAESELWSRGFSVRDDRNTETFVDTPGPLQRCSPELRRELVTTLLDVLRRNLAIKVEVLDPLKQRDLVDQTQPRLLEGTVWYLDELRELVQSDVAYPRPKRAGESSGLFISSYGSYGRYLRRSSQAVRPSGRRVRSGRGRRRDSVLAPRPQALRHRRAGPQRRCAGLSDQSRTRCGGWRATAKSGRWIGRDCSMRARFPRRSTSTSSNATAGSSI